MGIGELSGAEAVLAEREGYCAVAILLCKMSGAGRRVGTTFGLRRRTEDNPPYLPWEGRPTEDTEHTEREGLLARMCDPSVTFREFRGPNLLFLGQREQRNQPHPTLIHALARAAKGKTGATCGGLWRLKGP